RSGKPSPLKSSLHHEFGSLPNASQQLDSECRIATTEQKPDIVGVDVRQSQVLMVVAVEIRDHNAIPADGYARRRLKCSVAIAEANRHGRIPESVRHSKVEWPVAVEVANRYRNRADSNRQLGRNLKRSVA